jgi:hypothetical protein
MIAGQFNLIGKGIKVQPSNEIDTVQMDKKNSADTFIIKWWQPKTTIQDGISKIFKEMKNNYV